MATKCKALTSKARHDWQAYLKALGALNSAQGRKQRLRTFGRIQHDSKAKRAKANASIKAANSAATEAMRKFDRTAKVMSSCFKKAS